MINDMISNRIYQMIWRAKKDTTKHKWAKKKYRFLRFISKKYERDDIVDRMIYADEEYQIKYQELVNIVNKYINKFGFVKVVYPHYSSGQSARAVNLLLYAPGYQFRSFFKLHKIYKRCLKEFGEVKDNEDDV